MKQNILKYKNRFNKLMESELGNVKPILEQESEDMGFGETDIDIQKNTENSSSINKIMDFAYEMMNELAPDGPRNKEQYMDAIEQIKNGFNYTIRNLKGNINM